MKKIKKNIKTTARETAQFFYTKTNQKHDYTIFKELKEVVARAELESATSGL